MVEQSRNPGFEQDASPTPASAEQAGADATTPTETLVGQLALGGETSGISPDALRKFKVDMATALEDPEAYLESIRQRRTRADAAASNLVREHKMREAELAPENEKPKKASRRRQGESIISQSPVVTVDDVEFVILAGPVATISALPPDERPGR